MALISSQLAGGCWLLATVLAAQTPPPPGDSLRPAEIRKLRDEILVKERGKLLALADRLRKDGKTAEADQAGPDSSDAPAADGSSRFVLLAEVVPARPKGEVIAKGSWQGDREAIRLEAAKALFDLAGKAAKPPDSLLAAADECLRGVFVRQPDHAEARRLLGFLPYQGGWATPFAADKLTRKFVLDKTYGWVPGDWVPHLKNGELPGPRGSNRWLAAAEADALRRDWASKWEISTEHFKIYTNVPLNEAISFGRKLEDLHELFFALMADVIDPDRLPLAQRFKKPGIKPTLPNTKNAYTVYYFINREEYAQFLAPYQGDAAQKNLGTYIPRKESKQFGGVSYFFNDVGGQLDVTSTLYHEASHQLLFESAGPDDYARNNGQYWVFEGLGTYFETLQHEPDGSLRIGGLVGPRIAQAQKRLLQQNEFLPIEQLVGFSQARFYGEQGGGNIYRNYCEAMAVAVFLMQSDGERHREGFLDYVRDAYKGRFRNGSGLPLQERMGMPYADLDRKFLDYLGKVQVP